MPVREIREIKDKEPRRFPLKIFGIIVLLIVIIFIVINSIVIIPAGNRGVILNFGAVQNQIFGEGLHFKMPIVQTVEVMEVRTQKYAAVAASASQDLQDVSTEVALNFHIDASRVNEIYQRLGTEYGDRIIAPAIQESVKASTAQFNAEELISERPLVKTKIEEALKDRLQQFGIILETVSITDFRFSTQFTKAIEDKVTAQQQALKAENDLKRIKIEAEQQVAAAKGTAESIRIINEELQRSPQYLEWQAIQKWDGRMPLSTGGALPFINIPVTGNTTR